MLLPEEFIRAKRDGNVLGERELREFVDGIASDSRAVNRMRFTDKANEVMGKNNIPPKTVEDIFNNYIGKLDNKEYGVIQYFKEFLDKKKKLIGIDIQLGTWKKFNYAYLQVKDFIKWKFGKQIKVLIWYLIIRSA